MIKIEHLNKTYKSNKVKALDDINIEIKKGDIYGIVGLSGAGKSSLVRCINRLEEADSGKIIINNVDILSLSKKELIEQRKKRHLSLTIIRRTKTKGGYSKSHSQQS